MSKGGQKARRLATLSCQKGYVGLQGSGSVMEQPCIEILSVINNNHYNYLEYTVAGPKKWYRSDLNFNFKLKYYLP